MYPSSRTSPPTTRLDSPRSHTGSSSWSTNTNPSPATTGATKTSTLSTRSALRKAVASVGPPSRSSDWTPAAPCRDLVAAAAKRGEPIEYHEYPGAYHDFDDPDSKVRSRSGLARAATGSAHVGTNPAARDDARMRVPAFLNERLGK